MHTWRNSNKPLNMGKLKKNLSKKKSLMQFIGGGKL